MWKKVDIRKLCTFSLVLFHGAFLHLSFAEVVYHTGFEEMENGEQAYMVGSITGQGQHQPDITPWVQPEGEENEGAEIVMESTLQKLPPPEGSQMLQIQYNTGNPAVFQNFLSTSKALKQDFKVTFLLGVDGEPSNGTFTFAVQSSSGLNSGAWFGVRRLTTDPPSFGFFYKTTDSEGKMIWEKIGDLAFEPHLFYKIVLEIDYSNQTFGGKITSPNEKEILPFSHLPLLDQDGHMSTGKGFNRIYIGADQIGTKPLFLADDLTIETLP